ncbi:MAG: FHA domain-containing protein [Candidatus Acidiferrum sp.]
MGVLLEINAGPMAGKKIAIVTGQTVTFGRAAGRAQFALPHDTFMSGVHFAVECGPSGCRVQDRKSSNGTFLNGARIQDAMLANGDEIKGGQTIFAVKIVADAKLASLTAPQDVASPSASASPAAPPSVPPSAPSQRPRGAEPVPPAAPPADFRSIEAAPPAIPPAVPPVGRPAEESKPGPISAAPEAPRGSIGAPEQEPRHVSIAEPPAPPRRTADLDKEAADARPAPGAAEPAAKNALPRVEEPPSFRGVPSPPSSSAKPPRAAEEPAGAGAKPPREGEPPPGVAPHIAQKFGDRPAARGAGGPQGAAFSVMGWSFPAAPAEWQVQEGFGLQQSGHEDFPSSVAATEELLGGITLQQFVESQISMLRGYLRDPKIEPTMPPRVGGADESMAMDVRHSTKDGRELVYRRIYARSGSSVGVLTVTTLAADLPQVLQTLQPLLEGAAFRSTVNN